MTTLESLIQNPNLALARNLPLYLFYQRFNTTMTAREIEELEDNLIEEAILYSILTDLEGEMDEGKPRTIRNLLSLEP
jgi:hypothetical protein